MQLILNLIALATIASAAIPSKPVPGQFQNFVLAISYMNDFCATHADRKECREGYDHFGMALHGLWPNQLNDPRHNYQYCDVSKADFGNDWCSEKYDIKGELSAETYLALSQMMPGVHSCLYNHEWYAHGTCSGMSADDYFSLSAFLTRKFRDLPNFERFLRKAAGNTVTRSEIVAALAADLGDDAEDASVINCRRSKPQKKTFFTEIGLTLRRDKVGAFPAAVSLEKALDRGSCPTNAPITVVP